jgi:hypothetical protein
MQNIINCGKAFIRAIERNLPLRIHQVHQCAWHLPATSKSNRCSQLWSGFRRGKRAFAVSPKRWTLRRPRVG